MDRFYMNLVVRREDAEKMFELLGIGTREEPTKGGFKIAVDVNNDIFDKVEKAAEEGLVFHGDLSGRTCSVFCGVGMRLFMVRTDGGPNPVLHVFRDGTWDDDQLTDVRTYWNAQTIVERMLGESDLPGSSAWTLVLTEEWINELAIDEFMVQAEREAFIHDVPGSFSTNLDAARAHFYFYQDFGDKHGEVIIARGPKTEVAMRRVADAIRLRKEEHQWPSNEGLLTESGEKRRPK